MKVVLLVLVGILLWNNNQARQFTSDSLQSVSEFIDPNTNQKFTISF